MHVIMLCGYCMFVCNGWRDLEFSESYLYFNNIISNNYINWHITFQSVNYICFRWTYVSEQHTFLVCSPMTHFTVIYCVFLHDLKIIP